MEQKHAEKAIGRLRRIEGQIRGIQKMVEDDRYCVDILTQISATVAALHGVEDLVMENHLNTCVTDAMRSNDADEKTEKIDEIMKVMTKFRKHG